MGIFQTLGLRSLSVTAMLIFPGKTNTAIPDPHIYLRLAISQQKTRRWTNVGVMLGLRLRRWPNITPTLVQRLVFAGDWQWKSNKIILKQLGRFVSLNRNIYIAAGPTIVDVDHAAHTDHCIVRPQCLLGVSWPTLPSTYGGPTLSQRVVSGSVLF